MTAATRAYLECLIWSGINPDTDKSLEHENFDVGDVIGSSVSAAEKDVRSFESAAGTLIDGMSPEQIGHGFCLTRNRHGTGFWDMGLGEVGKALTKIAHDFGEAYLIPTEDGHLAYSS